MRKIKVIVTFLHFTAMPKKKSLVWEHYDETEKGKKAKCVYCLQTISFTGGSCSNLARHIKIKHPTVLFITQPQGMALHKT